MKKCTKSILQNGHAGRTLRGVGMTPEGIENNPVMYELVMKVYSLRYSISMPNRSS